MLAVNQLVGFGAGGGAGPMIITPIGSVVTDGSNNPYVFTTNVAVAAGETIVLVIMCQGNRSVVAVSDNVFNTYAQAAENNAVNGLAAVWHCLNPVALASGQPISIALSGSNTRKIAAAYKLNQTAAHFSAAAAQNSGTSVGTSTPGSVPSGGAVFAGAETQSASALTNFGGIYTMDFNGDNAGNEQAIGRGIATADGVQSFLSTATGSGGWGAVIAGYYA